MTMVHNVPKAAENIAHGRRLEREAREAEEAGDEARAKRLYERADLCFALNEAERRQEARRAAARVSVMDTPGVLTGPRGTSVLDD